MTHQPVMLAEALEYLAIQPHGYYLDCTFGRGGHSSEILERLHSNGRLWALDRDASALNAPMAQQLSQDSRFHLEQRCFSTCAQMAAFVDGQVQLDGILLDLGVSSPQLDNAFRGFSFLKEGPLDMRMDQNSGVSAASWLASVSEQQLTQVLFEYGEERYARRIAAAIIAERCQRTIATTRQLALLIEQAIPRKDPHKHPATRTFQAIRIAINQELTELTQGLQQSLRLLKPGGRLVVIAFHSLEDRIVKRFINQETGMRHDPGRLPVRDSELLKGCLKKIGKLKPSQEEMQRNARARSAIMRVAEKTA